MPRSAYRSDIVCLRHRKRPLIRASDGKADCPDTTTLRTFEFGGSRWGMVTVFILQHERPETDTHFEDVKFIGAYSTEATAKAAIERLRVQPGFQDYPDGFSIDEYPIDMDHWTEGFVLT